MSEELLRRGMEVENSRREACPTSCGVRMTLVQR